MPDCILYAKSDCISHFRAPYSAGLRSQSLELPIIESCSKLFYEDFDFHVTVTFMLLPASPIYDDLPVTARVTETAYYRHMCLILFYVMGEENNLKYDYGVLRECIIQFIEEFVLEDICTSIIILDMK